MSTTPHRHPSGPPALPPRTGLVIIGRNEGSRLERCLRQLGPAQERAVYVDSASSDGSPELARALGYPVVGLSADRPFTAARARNAGFDALTARWPRIEHVQFLDGDCVLVDGWLEAGARALEQDSTVALVTGQLGELAPDESPYHRLLQLEWAGPAGEIPTCGGNAMIRARVYRELGGMDPTLIAGEEGDLHARMRNDGWRLLRLPLPMARHDADLTRFDQWWRRSLRWGHTCAEARARSRLGPQPSMLEETRSNWLWGLALPAVALGGALPTLGLSTLALLGYPALYARILHREWNRGRSLGDAELFARYAVLAKLPQALGQAKFHLNRLRGRRAHLIEYKAAA